MISGRPRSGPSGMTSRPWSRPRAHGPFRPPPPIGHSTGSGGTPVSRGPTAPDTASHEGLPPVRPCPYTDIRTKANEPPAEDVPRGSQGQTPAAVRQVFLAKPAATLTPASSAERPGATRRRNRAALRKPSERRMAKRAPDAKLAKAKAALAADIETAEALVNDGNKPLLLEKALAEVQRRQGLVVSYQREYDQYIADLESNRDAGGVSGKFIPTTEAIAEGDDESATSSDEPAPDTAGESPDERTGSAAASAAQDPRSSPPSGESPAATAPIAQDTADGAGQATGEQADEAMLPDGPPPASPIADAGGEGPEASRHVDATSSEAVPAPAAATSTAAAPADVDRSVIVIKLEEDDEPPVIPQYQ